MKLWFTADLHLGHANIIKHCKRPFSSMEEMDAVLIDNINAVVSPGDRLFIVGDFCGQRRKAAMIQSYLSRINLNPEQIVLVLGNHDDEKESRKVFRHVHERYTAKHEDQRIVLDHYALRVWNRSHHGTWHLYGHSHGNLADNPHSLSFDVGVDCHQFKPLNFNDVADLISKKQWKPVDHHGRDED